MNVLIIEDGKAEAHIFSETLKRILDHPLRLHHKDTLLGAIELLEECMDDLDLIFLDLKLPDSDNWRHTYDAIAPYADKVPIIVMSGNDDKDVARSVIKEGAEDFIVKGGKKRNLDLLKETIEFAVCRHQKMKKLSDVVKKDEQCIHWLSGGYSI